jgi:hypothetical protein
MRGELLPLPPFEVGGCGDLDMRGRFGLVWLGPESEPPGCAGRLVAAAGAPAGADEPATAVSTRGAGDWARRTGDCALAGVASADDGLRPLPSSSSSSSLSSSLDAAGETSMVASLCLCTPCTAILPLLRGDQRLLGTSMHAPRSGWPISSPRRCGQIVCRVSHLQSLAELSEAFPLHLSVFHLPRVVISTSRRIVIIAKVCAQRGVGAGAADGNSTALLTQLSLVLLALVFEVLALLVGSLPREFGAWLNDVVLVGDLFSMVPAVLQGELLVRRGQGARAMRCVLAPSPECLGRGYAGRRMPHKSAHINCARQQTS